MTVEEEKLFADFLIKEKHVLSEQNYQVCLEVKNALKKWDLEKSIDKVIVDKGFLSEDKMNALLKEFKGGDENLIPGYRIIKKLGEGAMGEVYSGIDLENNNRPVAIKILYPYLGKKKSTAKRFLHEGTLCIEKLNHPNIVKGYEVGYEANHDFFFYVMELMEGKNIREMLDKDGPFSEPIALHILLQIASALEQAYNFKLVHRDIKPDNIMMTEQGVAKLCDLGLARDWTQDLSLTQTGAIMGTPFYISPEGAEGKFMDSRSDIYSLGATMYHIVVGKVPFPGENANIVLQRHCHEALIPPIAMQPNISAGLSAIIEMMMEKRPEDRYQTPSELIQDITRLQHGYAPNALLRQKDTYGITETQRPKSESSISFNILQSQDDSKVDQADKVEEYRIENDSPTFDSFIYINHNHRKNHILSPFLTTSEQRVLADAPQINKKIKRTIIILISIILLLILIILGLFFSSNSNDNSSKKSDSQNVSYSISEITQLKL